MTASVVADLDLASAVNEVDSVSDSLIRLQGSLVDTSGDIQSVEDIVSDWDQSLDRAADHADDLTDSVEHLQDTVDEATGHFGKLHGRVNQLGSVTQAFEKSLKAADPALQRLGHTVGDVGDSMEGLANTALHVGEIVEDFLPDSIVTRMKGFTGQVIKISGVAAAIGATALAAEKLGADLLEAGGIIEDGWDEGIPVLETTNGLFDSIGASIADGLSKFVVWSKELAGFKSGLSAVNAEWATFADSNDKNKAAATEFINVFAQFNESQKKLAAEQENAAAVAKFQTEERIDLEIQLAEERRRSVDWTQATAETVELERQTQAWILALQQRRTEIAGEIAEKEKEAADAAAEHAEEIQKANEEAAQAAAKAAEQEKKEIEEARQAKARADKEKLRAIEEAARKAEAAHKAELERIKGERIERLRAVDEAAAKALEAQNKANQPSGGQGQPGGGFGGPPIGGTGGAPFDNSANQFEQDGVIRSRAKQGRQASGMDLIAQQDLQAIQQAFAEQQASQAKEQELAGKTFGDFAKQIQDEITKGDLNRQIINNRIAERQKALEEQFKVNLQTKFGTSDEAAIQATGAGAEFEKMREQLERDKKSQAAKIRNQGTRGDNKASDEERATAERELIDAQIAGIANAEKLDQDFVDLAKDAVDKLLEQQEKQKKLENDLSGLKKALTSRGSNVRSASARAADIKRGKGG